MKATQGTTYRMLGTRLNDVANELENLRKMGATGKKLLKPSDDPAAIRPVLNTRKQLSNVDRYLETMGQSLDVMQATDGHLEHVENIMQRAQEIMVNVVNGSLNSEDRTVLADELVQLKKEMLDAANGNVDGKYIFAGYAEDTKPFSENPSYDPTLYDANDHRTWPVLYAGDENATSLEITPGEQLQVNLTGNDLFLGTSSWNQGPYNPPDPAGNPPNAVSGGRFDLFAELTQAEEAIRNNDPAAMQTSIEELQGAADQNRRLRSQLGNRASRVETAKLHQEAVRVDLKQVLSRYEDADAIEVFNDIVQQETAFQAALNITSKVSQLSILDFI
ncbi:flagellar hook-associated protein FlgL [Desulfogranum mediterraneum]|uniref:flagellar hook-associated protein FlgL n=1 Tax=Desulfogranum mediterraneum TaxID=160661 RepID=UPI00041E6652|nr:flagellar hook-associated protein FlgL [Desulfogranum mediterraneum]